MLGERERRQESAAIAMISSRLIPSDQVNEASFDAIKEGMTNSEDYYNSVVANWDDLHEQMAAAHNELLGLNQKKGKDCVVS